MERRIFGLNLKNPASNKATDKKPARIAIFGLASDYGCQVQMTNAEDHLLDVLGMFELVYWQLASSGELPEDYDIAVIEGAVCTQEHVELLKKIRETAHTVITIGACANTGGIPGLASDQIDRRMEDVYGDAPETCGDYFSPRPVQTFIPVDHCVSGCPIDTLDFVAVLQKALLGGVSSRYQKTLCGDCRLNERECFFYKGTICLGLVTNAGCDARCVSEGRPCKGCRGVAHDANIASAREIVIAYGLDPNTFDEQLMIFNQSSVM